MIAPRRLRALPDPQLLQDPRVLWNLLATERRQRAENTGSRCEQPEVTADMQEILAYWLQEVCEEENCEENVFPLAMSYVRKCLSLFPVEKIHLQRLGIVCVFLASKLKESVSLNVSTLEFYTSGSVPASEIREWELKILYQLRWDLEIIIPYDFLEYILERFLFSTNTRASLTKHSRIYMTICAFDSNIAEFAPSVIAAACVSIAMFRLGFNLNTEEDPMAYLAEVIQADTIEVQNCRTSVEPVLNKVMATSCKFRSYLTETVQEPHSPGLRS